jgi:hypothetical protein
VYVIGVDSATKRQKLIDSLSLIPAEYQLRLGELIDQPRPYKKLIKEGGKLSQIKVWSDSSQTVLLFTKTLNRVNGVLASVTTIDNRTGNTTTKVLERVDGVLDAIEAY